MVWVLLEGRENMKVWRVLWRGKVREGAKEKKSSLSSLGLLLVRKFTFYFFSFLLSFQKMLCNSVIDRGS